MSPIGGDLDRQARPLEDPARAMVLGWALAQVHAVGLEADIAGNGQPGCTAHAYGFRRGGALSHARSGYQPEGQQRGEEAGGE